MGLQGFAVLLFPLSVWWLVLAVASGRDHQRGRARYWYVGSVVVLITLAVSDIFVRTSIPIDEPFDHLASPRFVDDVALAMIGLVAVAITVWFARGPRMRNARGVDGPSLAAEPVNRANN
ncbi:MAG: hypothetical protein JWR52_3243 [Marmoricola sp.]|nr:hypothetical protein [Marmoricola sp.]